MSQVIAERTGATASEDEFFAEEEVQQDETAALQAEASKAAQNEIEEVQAAEEAARLEAEAQAKAAAEEAARITAEAQQAALAAQTAAISAEELKLLANIIYCEAGSESYVGKVAVGNVIMNRVKSASQPNTITEVVYAKGQFSPVRNGSLQRALSSDKADAACYQAAIEALAGAQPVGGKLFFRRNNGRSGQVIGHHVFY